MGGDEDALAQYGRELATVQPTAAPGERWQYSNVNYSLLGLLFQTVSGLPYEQYMHEQVFVPLEMANSYARLDVAQQGGLAVGYRYWFDQPLPESNPSDPRGMVSGANLIASAEDRAHVVITQLNGGRYNGRQILAPELVVEMQKPVADTGIPGAAYGLGLGVSLKDGRRVNMHAGDTANFHSQLTFSVEGRWGGVVLMNANTALAPTAMEAINSLGVGVAELVAGHLPQVTGSHIVPQTPFGSPGRPVSPGPRRTTIVAGVADSAARINHRTQEVPRWNSPSTSPRST